MLGLVIEKVQAWELLNNPEYCGQLTMGKFKELLLRAGYTEGVAQDAAAKRGWERLSAGLVQ